MTLQAIKYDKNTKKLEILDQLKLPHETVYVPIENVLEAHRAIKDMVVRGAPAIAIVAVLALASELSLSGKTFNDEEIIEKLDYLVTSRPTAVNLSQACNSLKKKLKNGESVIDAAEKMIDDDISDNKNIGKHGSQWIRQQLENPQEKFSVLTICNTGSLATAGYGTALGIIRSIHEQNKLERAYCLETRPYSQGSRLTAFELVYDKIPSTLITDSMAAALIQQRPEIKLIVVGADRVAANGDTANKIGTYQLACLAKLHGIKFMVAAPFTTIDFETACGSDIVIEERAAHELTQIKGPEVINGQIQPGVIRTICSAASGIDIWNPAFDVTPHEFIDAISTERGVFVKDSAGNFNLK